MRIGLFTDSYKDSGAINGVIYMVESMRSGLESLGHDVYVVAPKTGIARPKFVDKILWVPALQGVFFNEQLTSIFFPPAQLRTIAKMQLDIIVMFTPGQIGLLGANSATQQNIPLVSQYCTDLSEYIERYPTAIVGAIALGMTSPFALRLTTREMAAAMRSFITKDQDIGFRQHIIEKLLAALHSRCAAVIAVSAKTAQDLERWNPGVNIVTIPSGVDALKSEVKESKSFRKKIGVPNESCMLLYVGRLAKEKNLDVLIDSFLAVAKANSTAYLVFVGDFTYRRQLEARAKKNVYADRIIFAGSSPHEQLGAIYASADIFLFPSMTDTQALVVNEAAHAGLPFVWSDSHLNTVLVDSVTGIRCDPTPQAYADAILRLLRNTDMRKVFGYNARQKAKQRTVKTQARDIAQLLESLR
jgi:1,2-diacylglycerol 3-alpha-glucosyltransferase